MTELPTVLKIHTFEGGLLGGIVVGRDSLNHFEGLKSKQVRKADLEF